MMPQLAKEDLTGFTTEIAALFNAGQIRAPVHLSDSNEEALIRIFREVREPDWVCCSWRSHYHCLLKGVPPDELKAEILAGHSISLCFPKYRVVSSAIVGGILPIAVGLALAIQRRNESHQVWCFMGDMTAETGLAAECVRYATNLNLPIHFVIEDNGKSVCTDTRQAWGTARLQFEESANPKIIYYRYQTRYPHAGAGHRVQF